ncbi:MAG: hypothetical protein SGBAC_006121 [Bacillariaceae sp.]
MNFELVTTFDAVCKMRDNDGEEHAFLSTFDPPAAWAEELMSEESNENRTSSTYTNLEKFPLDMQSFSVVTLPFVRLRQALETRNETAVLRKLFLQPQKGKQSKSVKDPIPTPHAKAKAIHFSEGDILDDNAEQFWA